MIVESDSDDTRPLFVRRYYDLERDLADWSTVRAKQLGMSARLYIRSLIRKDFKECNPDGEEDSKKEPIQRLGKVKKKGGGGASRRVQKT